MKNQNTPLGRAGLLVIPIGIAIAFFLESFWVAIAAGAAIGALIANIKAVLLVGRFQDEINKNPLNKLQAKLQGVDSSMQNHFIFVESIIGAVVLAAWTAVAAGVAYLIR
ncbi:MAG: hypothetical protein HOP36_13485 [Methyloglobulus sp.]|nr:hypothetical protein [Methyloglobulus sp.]